MQVSPRYDSEPVIRFDPPVGDPSAPLLRQRRRLGKVLATIDDEQWATPSRCAGWSVQDVLVHLISTNQFFAVSIGSGMAGKPTRYLAGFDPVANPAKLVEGQRGLAPSAVLESYLETVESLADAVADRDDAAWALPAEAPSGHIAASAVALHALWDAWVHERDVLIPLGLTPAEEPDEIRGSLRYAAGLGPAFRATTGDARTGSIAFEATDPADGFVVELGPTVVVRQGASADDDIVRIAGPAVGLVEALSYRAPFDAVIPDDQAWMFDGLAEVFDLT